MPYDRPPPNVSKSAGGRRAGAGGQTSFGFSDTWPSFTSRWHPPVHGPAPAPVRQRIEKYLIGFQISAVTNPTLDLRSSASVRGHFTPPKTESPPPRHTHTRHYYSKELHGDLAGRSTAATATTARARAFDIRPPNCNRPSVRPSILIAARDAEAEEVEKKTISEGFLVTLVAWSVRERKDKDR